MSDGYMDDVFDMDCLCGYPRGDCHCDAELPCTAAGRDMSVNERGWFWECRDCGLRRGPFVGMQAADENFHGSHAAAGRTA